MRRFIISALLGTVVLGAFASQANAGVDFSIVIGPGFAPAPYPQYRHEVVVAPAPVYAPQPPVVYTPQPPVVYTPQPPVVYTPPPPVVYAPPAVTVYPGYYGGYYGGYYWHRARFHRHIWGWTPDGYHYPRHRPYPY